MCTEFSFEAQNTKFFVAQIFANLYYYPNEKYDSPVICSY